MFENNRNAYLTAFGLSLAPLPLGGLILLMIHLGVPLPGILETLLLATGFGISPLYITYSAYQQLGESWKQAAAFLLITGIIHLIITVINAMLLYAGVTYLQQRALNSMMQQMG